MNVETIIEKELSKSVEADFGEWCKNEKSVELGVCIYKSGVVNDTSISLYEFGCVYARYLNDKHVAEISILYDDINSIQSCLSAKTYSDAMSLPQGYLALQIMTLHLNDREVEFMLPLVVYSAVLRSLSDIVRLRK